MKEQIASGLRQMKTTPDFLLYCGDEIDQPAQIAGIRVLYTDLILNTTTDLDIPWIPLWSRPGDYILERKRFNSGYEDEKS
jgi:hypothetical protein